MRCPQGLGKLQDIPGNLKSCPGLCVCSEKTLKSPQCLPSAAVGVLHKLEGKANAELSTNCLAQ